MLTAPEVQLNLPAAAHIEGSLIYSANYAAFVSREVGLLIVQVETTHLLDIYLRAL